jgi:hypothetical protein
MKVTVLSIVFGEFIKTTKSYQANTALSFVTLIEVQYIKYFKRYLLVTTILGVHKTSQSLDFESRRCYSKEPLLANVELKEPTNAGADRERDFRSGPI